MSEVSSKILTERPGSMPATMDRPLRKIMWFILLRIPELLIGFIVAILAVFITVAVLSRYVFDIGITWSDELCRVLFVWVVFVGFAIAVRQRSNLSIEWFAHKLPVSWRRPLTILRDLTILLFSVFFSYQALITVRFSLIQQLTGLEISIAWLYSAGLVSGVLMMVYAIANFWDTMHAKNHDLQSSVECSMKD